MKTFPTTNLFYCLFNRKNSKKKKKNCKFYYKYLNEKLDFSQSFLPPGRCDGSALLSISYFSIYLFIFKSLKISFLI